MALKQIGLPTNTALWWQACAVVACVTFPLCNPECCKHTRGVKSVSYSSNSCFRTEVPHVQLLTFRFSFHSICCLVVTRPNLFSSLTIAGLDLSTLH